MYSIIEQYQQEFTTFGKAVQMETMDKLFHNEMANRFVWH